MRLSEGRASLAAALILLLRLGLPVTAFFVAFNPIWGFSWYFNTESWATGIYQKMTELRVDPWRIAMIDAVARLHGGASDDLFQINPDGMQGKADFSCRARLQYDVTTAADDRRSAPPSSSTATKATWLTKSTFRNRWGWGPGDRRLRTDFSGSFPSVDDVCSMGGQ
jgi:hypothetical protein